MTQTPDLHPVTARNEPDYDFLDPGRVRLLRDASGRVRLIIGGDRCYLDVKVVRVFPLSEPDRYIGLLDAKDKDRVIGLVVEPDQLEPDSRRVAADALGRHYFLPVIREVLSMREEFGAVYFDVQTDRGRRQFIAKGVRDATVELGEGELLISDVDGNRYRVADWRKLDPRSQHLLVRVI